MKVFISWSGEPSKAIALALRDWLPLVLQQVEPFMSKRDIPSGSRWNTEIGTHLSESGFGILCVTPDNPKSEWLLFEAGALARKLDDRVCPYVVGMEPTDLPTYSPLNQFMAKRANREETFELVSDINALLENGALDPRRLEQSFDAFWKKLEDRLVLPVAEQVPKLSGPTTDEMVREILETVRSMARQSSSTALRDALVQSLAGADAAPDLAWDSEPPRVLRRLRLAYPNQMVMPLLQQDASLKALLTSRGLTLGLVSQTKRGYRLNLHHPSREDMSVEIEGFSHDPETIAKALSDAARADQLARG